MSHCGGPADSPPLCNDWLELCRCRMCTFPTELSRPPLQLGEASHTSVVRGQNAKLRRPYHQKILLHQSHNTCPAATQLAPSRKHVINKKLLLLSKAIGHPYLSPSSAIPMHPPVSLRTFPSTQLILPPAHLVTMGSRAFSRSAPPTAGILCLVTSNTPLPLPLSNLT